MYPYQRKVLEYLRKQGANGTTPESIADSLGMTRAVVNQAIYSLRQLGYRIVRRTTVTLTKEAE